MANGVLKIATLNCRDLNIQLKRKLSSKVPMTKSAYRKHISQKIKQLNRKENGVESSFTVHMTTKGQAKSS